MHGLMTDRKSEVIGRFAGIVFFIDNKEKLSLKIFGKNTKHNMAQ